MHGYMCLTVTPLSQVVQFGLNHETGSVIEGQAVTVKDLLKDLYERACQIKHWALVRHTAGKAEIIVKIT